MVDVLERRQRRPDDTRNENAGAERATFHYWTCQGAPGDANSRDGALPTGSTNRSNSWIQYSSSRKSACDSWLAAAGSTATAKVPRWGKLDPCSTVDDVPMSRPPYCMCQYRHGRGRTIADPCFRLRPLPFLTTRLSGNLGSTT